MSQRVAVLHQAGPVPAVGGVIKPLKPGGYSDSSADIAYNLRAQGQEVVTPTPNPDPRKDLEWSFPDTIPGILSAINHHGANVLWANTTLHASHAIVKLQSELREVKLVGQNPLDVEKFEDKEWINKWLASQDGLQSSFPRSLIFHEHQDKSLLKEFGYPAVYKPIRGRGSHGVVLVKGEEEGKKAAGDLLSEGDAFLVEEYCAGEEITITVMPQGQYTPMGKKTSPWSLPVVTRFGHHNGIAPYNGIVAVVQNSTALSEEEMDRDPHYREAQRKCEIVAKVCKVTAPIRIDCRRREDGGEFVLFDVNMKPNATGPGRPGRDSQASLTTMAAEKIGWTYGDLLLNTLRQAKPISEVISSTVERD